MFNPELIIITVMALLTSPSPRSRALVTWPKKMIKVPPKIIRAYSPAIVVTGPAPSRAKIVGAKMKKGSARTIAAITIKTRVWEATASAFFLSFAPIIREIAALPPTPMPAERAMIKKKKGKKNPTADRASGPNPATQRPSTKLYSVWTDIATIIGMESLMMAFLGLPNKVCTPLVVGGVGWAGCSVFFMIKKRIRYPLGFGYLTR